MIRESRKIEEKNCFVNSTQRKAHECSPLVLPAIFWFVFASAFWLNLGGAVNYINSTHDLDIHISMTKANTTPKLKDVFLVLLGKSAIIAH
jgi:hypothetical protein